MHCHWTIRLDDDEILDGFLARMDEIERDSDSAAAEAKRRVVEICTNMRSSVADLHQHIKVWKERCSQWDVETSRS